MEIPANDHTVTPARQALDALAVNTEDTQALDTLAGSEVLVPVPDDANQEDARDPGAVALPVLEQPDGDPVVPVFTSEGRWPGCCRSSPVTAWCRWAHSPRSGRPTICRSPSTPDRSIR